MKIVAGEAVIVLAAEEAEEDPSHVAICTQCDVFIRLRDWGGSWNELFQFGVRHEHPEPRERPRVRSSFLAELGDRAGTVS